VRATAPSSCVHCGLPVPVSRRSDSATSGRFCCFGCRFAYSLTRPADGDTGRSAPLNRLQLRLGLGIFLTLNIMVFNWIFYSREVFGAAARPEGVYAELVALIAYLLMFLCSGVIVLLGVPLADDALATLFARGEQPDGRRRWYPRGRLDANLLICIGVGSAYLMSVIHTLRGAGSLYFDTAAVVLLIVTLGQYLEASAKRRAAASASALLASVPGLAWVRRDGELVEVPVVDVHSSERVLVRHGEAIPVDGCVRDGAGTLDESSLTGEHHPRAVWAGDDVLAGTVNLEGPLWVEAQRVGPDRAIARVQQLLDRARAQQPPIQRMVDRIASVFVPAVVLCAAGVLAWHAWNGRLAVALFDSLSVLLISCPCALGLAAPLATWHALRRAAGKGILIDSPSTLERAARVRKLFFDKTGTLTDPRPSLARMDTAAGIGAEQALAWAASIETTSRHPVAAALIAAARARGVTVGDPDRVVTLPGVGVEAEIDGRRLRLGSERLLDAHRSAAELPPPVDDTAIRVYLTDDQRVLARFELTESLRPEAEATVATLREMGVAVEMLTGDRSQSASRIAAQLGIDFQAGLLPGAKLDRLTAAGANGERQAMVGDGVNDAPVLAAADVGFSMGSASDLARRAGGVRLIADRLDRVPMTLALSRHCMRRVRMNLTWMFSYNIVGIALAAAGLLNPIVAALAMLSSSLTVVLISRGAGRIPTATLAAGAAAALPRS